MTDVKSSLIQGRSYLAGRLRQVFDAPNAKRPRWTVQDAHAVRDLMDENTPASRSRGVGGGDAK